MPRTAIKAEQEGSDARRRELLHFIRAPDVSHSSFFSFTLLNYKFTPIYLLG